MNRLSNADRVSVLAGLVEGNSLRSIARMTGLSVNTVMKFVADFGPVCEAYHDENVRGIQAKRVQADEIWAFCYFFNDTAATEIYTLIVVGSVRCV